jgi:ubiquinone/menaquinone biosynthesis C-methylase UbiE
MWKSLFQKHYWERKELADRRPPDHPVVRSYVEPKVGWIKKKIPLSRETHLLDVGCGNGFFSRAFARDCDTVGVDFSKAMLSLNPLKQKLLMDANRLCFQDMAFDVVFCHALLHHVEDEMRVLSEMRRVSKKYVIVLEPNRANPLMALFSSLVPEERKALRFSRAYLQGRLEQSGLRVLAYCAYGWLAPNKTPLFLLPLLRFLNFPQSFGMTHIFIAER